MALVSAPPKDSTPLQKFCMELYLTEYFIDMYFDLLNWVQVKGKLNLNEILEVEREWGRDGHFQFIFELYIQ